MINTIADTLYLIFLEFFLIIKATKLLVKAKAIATAAQKNKVILAKIVIKAQKELFCLAITKLL